MSTIAIPKEPDLIDSIKICCHKCDTRMELENVKALSIVECRECSTELRIPKQVGDLLLEQKINKDENFSFYRGTELRLNRPAIIKVINKEMTSSEEIYSFGIGTFCHQNIIPIYSVEIIEGTYHLITENIIGQTLEHFLDIGDKLEAEDILGVAQQVSDTMKVAAENNIHHGHLSLDSIWVTIEGDCEIADFGIRERLYTQDLKGIEHVVKNSVYFKDGEYTPEQKDLYSFGVCLHKLAVGEFPINGTPMLENSRMPSYFNKIIQGLLSLNISSFKEMETLLEGEGADLEEKTKTVKIPKPKLQKTLLKIPTKKKPRTRKTQVLKINSLKKQLLISRGLFFAVLLFTILFFTSRYLPETGFGKFSEGILNITLDKLFAKQ